SSWRRYAGIAVCRRTRRAYARHRLRARARRRHGAAGMSLSTFAVVGLGTMGRNLALNVEEHGFPVAVWNLETDWTDAFIRDHAGARFTGTKTLQELAAALERPRRIMVLIPAGAPVDEMIVQLAPLLDQGDILIDGGNSYFEDTRRREAALRPRGLNF